MRIAALTFVRKEQDWLPVWLRYYVNQADEMFVINPNKEKYPLEPKWTEIKTDGDGGNSLRWGQDRINEAIKDLLKSFKWVVYSDADEYIIPKSGNLKTYLEYKAHQDLFTCNGYDLLHMDGEPKLDITQGIFNQRTKWVPSHAYCKTVVTRVPITLADGCHYTQEMYAESGLRNVSVREVIEENITKNLYLVHMRRADKTLYYKKGDRASLWDQEREVAEDLPTWIKEKL